MTTTARLFPVSLLMAGILSAATSGALGAATNSGALNMGPASGALGTTTISGALGVPATSGTLGMATISGTVGTPPTSGALSAGPAFGAVGAVTNSGTPATVTGVSKTNSLNVVPVLTGVSLVGSNLVASGVAYVTVKGQTALDSFTAPVTLQPVAMAAAPTNCPVLNLQLGPISLNLLGLVVDTGGVCATITAYPDGGLLGQLLCSVTTLLQGGTPLVTVLNGLTTTDLNNLLLGITSLLNGALSNLSHALVSSIMPGSGGTCSVLNLTLGPLTLNLLGLDVLLNNCTTGPLTATITADRGGLLGNALCGLLNGNQIPLGTGLAGILDQLLGLPSL